MSTLRETIYKSVIELHRKTGKEWIHLKEIYKDVAVKRKGDLKNGGSSVRGTLERHSALSKAFKGPEEYILKEKGTGLYKCVFYDQIKFVDNITIGDVFTNDEFMNIFKISDQSSIMKSNALDCLVLTTSLEEMVHGDSVIGDGHIIYTGEGLIGDQAITENNKIIYESNKNDIPMYLFSEDNKNYTFEGKVKLSDKPYQVKEKDINGNERMVWKFPLEIIYSDDIYNNIDENFKEVVNKINEIKNQVYSNMNKEKDNLEYRAGKINIRKYRKTDAKLKRNKKPDYIAEEIIKTEQGIINEENIFKKELKILEEANAMEQVKKMKDFFENKKDNEGFDILSFELNEDRIYVEKYIEVKSTKGSESTPIDITADEIDFAKKHIDNYYLYRIINSDSKDRYLKIVKGKDLFNEEDYKFVPTNYKIYSS